MTVHDICPTDCTCRGAASRDRHPSNHRPTTTTTRENPMPITTDLDALVEHLFTADGGWSTMTGPATDPRDADPTWTGDLTTCRLCVTKVWVTDDQYTELAADRAHGMSTAILCEPCDARVEAMLRARQIGDYISLAPPGETDLTIDLTDIVCFLEDLSIDAIDLFGPEHGQTVLVAANHARRYIDALVTVLTDIRAQCQSEVTAHR